MKALKLFVLLVLLIAGNSLDGQWRLDKANASTKGGIWEDQGGGINWRHWKCTRCDYCSVCFEYDWLTYCSCEMTGGTDDPPTPYGPSPLSVYFNTMPTLNSDGEYVESGYVPADLP